MRYRSGPAVDSESCSTCCGLFGDCTAAASAAVHSVSSTDDFMLTEVKFWKIKGTEGALVLMESDAGWQGDRR